MRIAHMLGLSSEAVLSDRLTRRGFLCAATATSVAFALPKTATAAMERLGQSVRLGVIADLHHDVMHDGAVRLGAFVKEMEAREPDAIVQLGDFAYPNAGNKALIDEFNQSHEHSLHVIGNHDTDAGHTKQQCLDNWGMTDRYYAQRLAGLWLLVLDGNDGGSPTHKGGYPSYRRQSEWVGKSPAEVGVDLGPTLKDGEEIAPRIRNRQIFRMTG